ncbi:ead/Ea22-like family protein [Escherichia coli]
MSNIDKQALRKTAEKAQEHGVFNMDIHSQTVLALLDELEKMQAQSSKWCEAFHKAVSVGARYEERIAELEVREVKLPLFDGYVPHIAAELQAAFRIACADAGIGIKGEGE